MTAKTTLQQIAPSDLIIDTNVRLDPTTDRSFVASIRQHGVLSAITGQADTEGRVHVRMGQRRTLAAVEAGIDTVPVMVLPADATDDEATRIIEQLAENDHREALTDKDRVTAVEALTGLGLSAAQIQRRTNRPKAEVTAAMTVNGSAPAREAVEAATLTLAQGAILAEFEDDPEALDSLMAAAVEGRGFEHKAQLLRDERERQALYDTAVEELTAQGLTVIVPPSYSTEGTHPDAVRLIGLVTADDRSDLTPENHTDCPGHAVAVRVDSRWNHDEGQNKWVTTVQHYCTDPTANGHVDRYANTGSDKKRAKDMTETEREEAKAERREVIENNKAWTAAETVRREWLANFLTRKTAPKGTAEFIAAAIALGAWQGAEPTDHKAGEVIRALGIDTSVEAVAKASAGRALVLVLAGYLAAYEAKTDRDDWRNPKTCTRDYLGFLAANGYDLSEVEQRAATTD